MIINGDGDGGWEYLNFMEDRKCYIIWKCLFSVTILYGEEGGNIVFITTKNSPTKCFS